MVPLVGFGTQVTIESGLLQRGIHSTPCHGVAHWCTVL